MFKRMVEGLTRVFAPGMDEGAGAGCDPALEARRWFAAARSVAAAIDAAEARTEMLRAIAEAQAAAGDVAGARQTARTIRIGRAQAYASHAALCAVARLQARAGDTAGAAETADLIDDEDVRGTARRSIAEARAQAGDAGAALAIVEAIAGQPERESALGAVARAQARSRDVPRALETWSRMRDPVECARTIRHIVETARHAGGGTALDRLREVVRGARAAAATVADTERRVRALLDIARAEEQVGAWAAARQTARDAAACGSASEDPAIRREAVIQAAQVLACAGDPAAALHAVETLPSRDHAWARSRIAQALAKTGRVDAASDIAARIANCEAQASAWRAIARALLAAGDVDGARRAAGVLPGSEEKDSLVMEIAQAIARSGDVAAALDLAAAHVRPESTGHTLRLVAHAQINAGDVAGALRTAERITDRLGKTIVRCWIAERHGRSGDLGAARAALEEAHRLVREGPLPAAAPVLASMARIGVGLGEAAAVRAWIDGVGDPLARAHALMGGGEGWAQLAAT